MDTQLAQGQILLTMTNSIYDLRRVVRSFGASSASSGPGGTAAPFDDSDDYE